MNQPSHAWGWCTSMTPRDLNHRLTSAALPYSLTATDSVVVLALSGDVDMAMSADLRRVLGDLSETGHPDLGSGHPDVIVVDLSEVRLIDAEIIGVIVSAHRAALARGRQLYVDGLRALPARVFAVLGLDGLRLPQHVRPMRLSQSLSQVQP